MPFRGRVTCEDELDSFFRLTGGVGRLQYRILESTSVVRKKGSHKGAI